MNIVDALFITLGLDTTDYEKKKEGVLKSLKDVGEASDKQTKTIAESGKKAANAFSLLKVEVLGALAAFGVSTGLKDFITQNMNGQAALGRMALNLNTSAGELKAWGYAAEAMGGKAEDAYGSLQNIAKGIAEARITGHSALTDASRRFGFSIDTKDNEKTLLNISARMAQLKDRQQALAVADAAGVGQIGNLLLVGPQKIEQMLAKLRQYTDSQDPEKAAELQWQFILLKAHLQQISDKIFAKVGPILEVLGEKLAKWLDSIDWQAVINRIAAFLDKVNEVVKALGGWKTIAEVLGGVLALKLLSPLLGIIGAFTRLLPLLGSATGAFTGLGVAGGAALAILAGGAIGGAVGTVISKNLSDDTNDKIGNGIAHVLAFFGNKEAQEAIDVRRAGDALATSQQGKPVIGSDIFGKYDPMHSRRFSSNDKLFDYLDNKYGLPAGTLAKKFKVESNNGQNLISKVGALGPMQFMPKTAAQYGLGDNVMDLDASAEASARMLRDLYKQFGGWDKAEAAYNWGGGNLQKDIAKHGANWLGFAPAETQNYVRAHQLAMRGNGSQGAVDKSVSVTINGGVNVNAPKATNAREVAGGMRDALNANPLIGGSVLGAA